VRPGYPGNQRTSSLRPRIQDALDTQRPRGHPPSGLGYEIHWIHREPRTSSVRPRIPDALDTQRTEDILLQASKIGCTGYTVTRGHSPSGSKQKMHWIHGKSSFRPRIPDAVEIREIRGQSLDTRCTRSQGTGGHPPLGLGYRMH
jgi:hypothetical protein